MSSTITDLSHQKTHILSLYLLVVVIKKSEIEDKAENYTKPKKKIDGNKNEYRK